MAHANLGSNHIGVIAAYSNNIGDDIQTLAALRFAPDAAIVHRKKIGLERRVLKIIGNAWWTEADAINPRPDQDMLPISMHIAPGADESLYNYLRGKTVGARDRATLRELQARGIDAYFSGCLTLTLPRYTGKRTGGVVFTDNIPQEWIPDGARYSKHVDNDWINLPIEDKLELARQKLELYANAELVITGRLHAALPCIALGTPVLLNTQVDFDKHRFEGLTEYLHTEFRGHEPSDYPPKPRPVKLIKALEQRVQEYVS
jgi:hypothetical protein